VNKASWIAVLAAIAAFAEIEEITLRCIDCLDVQVNQVIDGETFVHGSGSCQVNRSRYSRSAVNDAPQRPITGSRSLLATRIDWNIDPG